MNELKFYILFIFFIYIVILELILHVEVQIAKLLSLNFFILIFIFFSYIFTLFDFSPFKSESYFFYSSDLQISSILNISLTYGIDPVTILFLLLTSFIFVLASLASWNSIKTNIKNFLILLILLEFFIVNVFTSFDLLFFYFWFESSLLPIFFIILIWGNNTRKIAAAFSLLMYTLLFSALFFLAIIFLNFKLQTTNIFLMINYNVISEGYQKIFFIAFFLTFIVKLPIFPVHLWLPEAHVEAPTVGSLLLASILLKLGYYGILRFVLQLFPLAVIYFKPIIASICIISSTYTALISLSQFDLKKIIAYSSISHMSLTLIGVFSGNFYGVLGSLLLAIGHTFVSAALFLSVGFIYDRYHTRIITYYSGLSKVLPVYSTIFFISLISNFGFPISLNFVGEFLIFIGVGKWNFNILLSFLVYSVISVAYNLYLYVRIFHGTRKPAVIYIDISKSEILSILPVLLGNSWFFFKVNSIIKYVTPFIISISF